MDIYILLVYCILVVASFIRYVRVLFSVAKKLNSILAKALNNVGQEAL